MTVNKPPNHLQRLIRLIHGIGTKYDAVAVASLLFLLPLLPYAAAQSDTASSPPPTDFNLGPAFNPTMAIIMIILVSAFFLMGFFSVYVRQCAERRIRGGQTDTALLFGAAHRSWRAARGLGEEVIRTFPTFRYSAVKRLKIGKGSLECAEFEDDETLRLLPKCSHVFHSDCIDAWLSSHTTCPVCRANLLPKPGEDLSTTIQIFDPADSDSGEPDRELNMQDQEPVMRSPEVNQNRPPRSKSTGLRFTGLFPRSNSTGHSVVQPGEDCERFTLRLPEEVRSQILNSSLNRTQSLGVLPRVRSARRGYRSGSVGSGRGRSYSQYERFDREARPDRWGFSMTPPFFSRTGSERSPKPVGGGDEAGAATTPPRSLLKSVKSPLNRSFLGPDDVGERSSDRLRNDSEV